MVRFDLKVLSFFIFLWGMFNLTNGFMVFFHELMGGIFGEGYYYITGTIRIMVGITTLVIFWYIWRCADKIVIFKKIRKEGE